MMLCTVSKCAHGNYDMYSYSKALTRVLSFVYMSVFDLFHSILELIYLIKYSVYLINVPHVLINFLKFSNLHGLITSCMLINFWKFSSQFDFFTIDFWKIPTCMALLHPARLLILGNFPACMIITSCTFIR